jgi:hypothetical protein
MAFHISSKLPTGWQFTATSPFTYHNNCLRRRVLKNPIIFQMDNKFSTFTQHDSIVGFICLSNSEEPASGPYRDPQSGPLSTSHSLRCLVLPFATYISYSPGSRGGWSRNIQGSAEPSDTFWHMIIFCAGSGWNEMHELYAQSKQLITFLVDNILKVASFICTTWSSTFVKLSKTRRNISWSQFYLKYRAAAPVLCADDFCIRILWSIPVQGSREPEVRRPYRPWDTQNMKMLFVAH